MLVNFSVKQGSTFLLHGVCCQDDGTAIDLTDAVLTCELRNARGLVVGVLAVDVTDPENGIVNFSASSAATANWPVGRLLWDACFVQNDVVIYSDTATMIVSAPRTPAPVVAAP